ncbi:MAG: efflux RND transporter periplasmic adaptor subunit [Gammaproteobacteria bacterium]|nr:efflux RND transporter periplasmic adaptor subunit [Gammaproteobacteria bacterium]
MQPAVKLLLILALLISQNVIAQQRVISSLGRLEPENGVVQLAGPSGGGLTGAVMTSLAVAEGDWVEKGQVVARLDSYDLRKAEVARLEAILANARNEMARQQDLDRQNLTSKSNLDTAQMGLDIALADLAAAKASLELSIVRAPLRAQVLEIHAYPGERVGPEGVMELGRTDRMYAVAEVYETDIAEVEVGQVATIRTTAIDDELLGKVERISLKVGRLDVIGADPIAKTDARVVEVFILLDDSEAVSRFTNMQVKLEIQP